LKSTGKTPQKRNYGVLSTIPYAVAKIICLLDCCKLPGRPLAPCKQRYFVQHESPRRGENFGDTENHHGPRPQSRPEKGLRLLGNLNASGTGGTPPDYVQAMWLMLQQESLTITLLRQGKRITIKEFAEKAFGLLD